MLNLISSVSAIITGSVISTFYVILDTAFLVLFYFVWYSTSHSEPLSCTESFRSSYSADELAPQIRYHSINIMLKITCRL